jgi:hypothetical protein
MTMRMKSTAALGTALALAACQHSTDAFHTPVNASGLPITTCNSSDFRLITTADDAMHIAYAFIRAAHPGYPIDDEKIWARDMTASLDGCVWRVAENPKPPYHYSDVIISIAAEDGRFMGILVSD